MILDIKYDSQTIPLRSSLGRQFSIFDIDSLTLVIGKNGSGKTELLKSIASEISSSGFNDFGSKCEINFDNGDEKEKLRWGCVYYTPVPYQPEFKNKKRFANASLIDRKSILTEGLDEQKEIIEDFGIEVNFKAVAGVNIRPILGSIISTAVANLSLKTRPGCYFFSKFKSFNQYVEIIRDHNSLLENFDEHSRLRSKIKGEAQEEIIKWLSSNFSKYQIIAFFILLSTFVRGINSTKNKRALKLFVLFFGEESESRKLIKPKDYDDFTAEHHKITEFLYECRDSYDYDWLNDLSIDLKKHSHIKHLHDGLLDRYFKLRFSSMSSGELAVINQLTSIAEKINELKDLGCQRILLLIDEGDAFLHLEWQRLYIFQLNKLLGKIKLKCNIDCLQVIMATHSPLLATDVPKEYVFSLDKEKKPKFAFASPMHMLFNDSFGTATIGEFATQKINEAYIHFSNGQQSESDYIILKCIDSEVLKQEFERQFDIGLNE